MSCSQNRGTLAQLLHNSAANRGPKENLMKSSVRLSCLVTVIGLSALMLGGLRCNTPTPAVTPTTTVPTYTEKTVYDRITWPASNTINQAALQAIPESEREKIKLSGVPVLVPNDPKFLQTAVVAEPDEHGYMFGPRGSIDGINLSILATRVGSLSENTSTTQSNESDSDGLILRGINVSFSQNENDTWSATWSENGQPAYLIFMSCVDRADLRCVDRAYLASIIQNLVFVGGNFFPYETTVSDK